jgi:cytochrome c oxidase subunit 4
MTMTERAHPTPRLYWAVALVLAALTAVEITIPQVSAFDGIKVPALLGLGAIKFAAVIGFFMHLRFDKKLYRNLFFIGLLGALVLFVIVLLTFGAL